MITNRLKLMIGAVAIAATAVGTTAIMYSNSPNNDGPLYAAPAPQLVCTTTLDYEKVGVSGTTYTDWTYSTGWAYKLVGQSAGDKNSIQLRSKNSNSGIVTQDTTLYCYRVEVNWHEDTDNARVLDIYGRKEGNYDSPTELYSNAKEKIGSIAKENQTAFDINYAYTSIGLRSNNGAMYLSSITFYWTNSLPAVPEEPEQSSSSSSSSSNSGSSSSSTVPEMDENIVTIHPSDFTAATSADYSTTKGNIAIAVTASTVTADQIRVFKNQTISISSDKNITSIEFTCTASGTAKYGPGCFTTQSGYSYNGINGTWTGSSKSIAFTAETNQVRITEIIVTTQSN